MFLRWRGFLLILCTRFLLSIYGAALLFLCLKTLTMLEMPLAFCFFSHFALPVVLMYVMIVLVYSMICCSAIHTIDNAIHCFSLYLGSQDNNKVIKPLMKSAYSLKVVILFSGFNHISSFQLDRHHADIIILRTDGSDVTFVADWNAEGFQISSLASVLSQDCWSKWWNKLIYFLTLRIFVPMWFLRSFYRRTLEISGTWC